MTDMERNENLETEELQGGIDQNGQQKEKLFTQEQVNEIVKKRLAKVKQQEGAEPPEDYSEKSTKLTEKEAELTAKENRLNCQEYVIEKGYPKELLDTLDTTDVEKFKERADMLNGIYGKKEVQPFGSAEFDGVGSGTIKDAFAYGRKHKPDTSAIGR